MSSVHIYHLLGHPSFHMIPSPLCSLFFPIFGFRRSLTCRSISGPWGSYCCSHHSGPSMTLFKVISSLRFFYFVKLCLGEKTLTSLVSHRPSWGFCPASSPSTAPQSRLSPGAGAWPPFLVIHQNNFLCIYHFPLKLLSLSCLGALVLTQLYSLT